MLYYQNVTDKILVFNDLFNPYKRLEDGVPAEKVLHPGKIIEIDNEVANASQDVATYLAANQIVETGGNPAVESRVDELEDRVDALEGGGEGADEGTFEATATSDDQVFSINGGNPVKSPKQVSLRGLDRLANEYSIDGSGNLTFTAGTQKNGDAVKVRFFK